MAKPTRTPLEIAEAFMAAYDSHDHEAAIALLDPDAVVADVAFRGLAELEPGFETRRQYGFHLRDATCQIESGEGGQETARRRVLCAYALDSRLQQILAYQMIETAASVTVSDGFVVAFLDGFPFREYGDVFSTFWAWLDEEHPGAFHSLFYEVHPSQGGGVYPRLTTEALDLISAYVDDYQDWVNSRENDGVGASRPGRLVG